MAKSGVDQKSSVLWVALEPLPHLRAWREYQSYGVRELARLADLNQATLYNLEVLGRPAQPKTVRALARSLGITVQQLRQPPPDTRMEPET